MFLLFLFILGLVVGSFLNVLIDRLSQDQSILGRSECDHCKKKIQWFDLVPVFSYLNLRGRCRYCKKVISLQYPIVELLTGVLFIFTWTYIPVESLISRFLFLVLISCLIVVFFADAKYQIIPDEIQLATLIISLSLLLVQALSPMHLAIRFAYALLVMLPILVLFLLTKGRGMGFADVKLAFTIGLLLGLKSGFLALYLGFILGAVIGIALIMLGRKKMKSRIAFGPFLVLGMMFMIFFEKRIHLLLSLIIGL